MHPPSSGSRRACGCHWEQRRRPSAREPWPFPTAPARSGEASLPAWAGPGPSPRRAGRYAAECGVHSFRSSIASPFAERIALYDCRHHRREPIVVLGDGVYHIIDVTLIIRFDTASQRIRQHLFCETVEKERLLAHQDGFELRRAVERLAVRQHAGGIYVRSAVFGAP